MALEDQYLESAAVARFRSMLAKSYRIEPLQMVDETTNAPVQKIKAHINYLYVISD